MTQVYYRHTRCSYLTGTPDLRAYTRSYGSPSLPVFRSADCRSRLRDGTQGLCRPIISTYRKQDDGRQDVGRYTKF